MSEFLTSFLPLWVILYFYTLQQMETDLTTWRNLNTARGSLSILGWFVLSLAPVADRLTKNLKEADDNLLGTDVELGKA